MSTWHVGPSGPLRGTLVVPGDKSISHRALLLNALATGPARIRNLLGSEDVVATANALRQLGVVIEDGAGVTTVLPPQEGLREPAGVLDCGNSGTSIRLLAGVLSARPFLSVLSGDPSLRRRPMARIVEPLRRMGADIDGRQGGRLCPLVIRGKELTSARIDLPIASAQVKSAVLLAGLGCGVAVREPGASRDHTERMLVQMGVSLTRAEGWLESRGIQALAPVDVDVPGDLSAAAFFLVAATLVAGSELRLPNVGTNPSRSGVLEALYAMGADIELHPLATPGEPRADLVVRSAPLRGTRIAGDLALRCLDELPVLAVAAAFAEGETVISDAAELRVKESDRIAQVAAGLRTLGIDVEERPDGMIVQGGRPRGPGEVDATGDHRIAMAFAVAGAAIEGGVRIRGAESVSSSYPAFARHLDQARS